MDHIVIGLGEIGSSIKNVLKAEYFFTRHHGLRLYSEKYDVAHICIPYTKDFKNEVIRWKKEAPLVIVHSTTPVGVCDSLGVVHSPVTGVHPHMEDGIRTFVKYFGGAHAKQAAKIFEDLGIRTKIYPTARTTEAMKLWSTTQYGRLIMLEKEIYKWCKDNNLDFEEIYTRSNLDYNEGYTKLGMPHVVRPVLKHVEGEIGGHCVVPNAKLLKVKL